MRQILLTFAALALVLASMGMKGGYDVIDVKVGPEAGIRLEKTK